MQFTGHMGYVQMLVLDAGACVAPIIVIARDRATFDAQQDAISRFLASVKVRKTAGAPAPGSAPPATQLAAKGKKSITASDVAGSWTHSTSSHADYVSSSTGAYAGSSTIAYGQGYDFAADGTYQYSFTGMINSRYVKEKDSGTWRFEGRNLMIRSRERDPKTYQIIEYKTAPDGTTFMTLLSDYYPPTEGNIGLYGEKFARAPNKPRAR